MPLRSVSSHLGFNRLYSRPSTTPVSATEQPFFYSHQSINQALDDEMLAGIKGDLPTKPNPRAAEESFLNRMDEITLLKILLFKTNPSHQSVNGKFVANMLKVKETQDIRAKHNSGISKSFHSMDLGNLTSTRRNKHQAKTTKRTATQDDFTISVDKVKKFAHSAREITASDVGTFLRIHAQSESTQHASAVFLAYLEELIMQSNENSLPAIAQFIVESLWEGTGFAEFIPEERALQEEIAQNQISLVLTRALEVFPFTTISTESGEVEETAGVARLTQIEKMLDQFSANNETNSLKDLFLRLVSQSGTYERAKALINKYTEVGHTFTEDTIDMFIQLLSQYSHAKWEVSSCTLREFNASLKSDLLSFQSLFISESVTPAITNFLLDFVVDPNEFYGILDVVEGSRHRDRILSTCQPQILKAAVRCHLRTIQTRDPSETNALAFVNHTSQRAGPHSIAMSHMFGLLSRFDGSSAGITSEALEECLVLSARLGNSAGMHQALALRLHLTQGESSTETIVPLPNKILSKVFDAFPISAGAVAQEKMKSFSPWIVNDAIIIDSARDESILFHLRSQLDPLKNPKEYSQYLSALGRCSRSDLILYEWQKLAPLINENVNDSHFQDVVMTLLAAFKTADSAYGGEVLKALLEASTIGVANHGCSLNLLTKVLNHELLPLAPTLHVIAKWLLNNPQAGQWSDADVTQLFSEVSPHSVHLPELIGTANDSLIQLEIDRNQAAHLALGKALSDLVNHVRNGEDVKLALNHVENLFGKYA